MYCGSGFFFLIVSIVLNGKVLEGKCYTNSLLLLFIIQISECL